MVPWSLILVFLITIISRLSSTQPGHDFYTLTPIKIGAEVRGVDLTEGHSTEVIRQVVRDTYKYKLLVFKDQKKISAQRHVDISKWFGEEVNTVHRQHPKAEHPAVFRVSNDEHHGFTGIGSGGWHIDGFFAPNPHTFVLYFLRNTPTKGCTVFTDLNRVVQGLSPQKKAEWDRIYTQSTRREFVVHPLIYKHPVTGQETMCINTEFVKEFIRDNNMSDSTVLSKHERLQLIQDIEEEFQKDEYSYAHKWEKGDFLMTDNLALAHIADPDTQLPPEEIGLRVLHRVSISGSTPPMKNPPALAYNPLAETPPPSLLTQAQGHSFYTLKPIAIGAEVHGVDLNSDPSPEMIRQIVRDTYEYKLLVFKRQNPISAERHLTVSGWFGKNMDNTHRQHPKAQHPEVFRVSNEDSHGYSSVGTYWHIDGYFTARPHTFVMYYMPNVPTKGHTVFADLYKIVESMSPLKRAKWNRLYTRSKVRTRIVHPLIYKHPVTGKQTICVNVLYIQEIIKNYNTPENVTLSEEDKEKMIEEIIAEFDHAPKYAHKWEEGDFLMTDNLALGHYADNDTQLPAKEIGLRILHRVSVKGVTKPSKNPTPLRHNPLTDDPVTKSGLAKDEL